MSVGPSGPVPVGLLTVNRETRWGHTLFTDHEGDPLPALGLVLCSSRPATLGPSVVRPENADSLAEKHRPQEGKQLPVSLGAGLRAELAPLSHSGFSLTLTLADLHP